ncbi:MAG: PrgI family protein [Candidatus Saccharimonadales bacterium]
MAVYKVPQDVEADDKLIGPFSFRQFIYLIVVAISIAGAWGLSQIFLALVIIPLPIIVFFGALALPLRKDQPMETYLSAVVSFYFLKSRKRFWIPDGIDSFVTIIPPKDADRVLTKDLGEDEATRRLNYLADLVDTHGWAIRGAGTGGTNTSINKDLYYESQQAPDMMDNKTPAAQALTQQLSSEVDQRRQDAIQTMQSVAKTTPTPIPPPTDNLATVTQPQVDSTATPVAQPTQTPIADPLPVSTLPSLEEIRARQDAFINKNAEKDNRDAIALATALTEEAEEIRDVPQIIKTAPTTSVSTPDTGTIGLTREQADELSQQTDVSVQTLANEANRVASHNKVLKNGDEVTISFH